MNRTSDQDKTAQEQPQADAAASDGQTAAPKDKQPESRPAESPAAPAWEADLDVYPLRPGNEDPGWARKCVWTWVGFALFSILFIVVWLIAGMYYH